MLLKIWFVAMDDFTIECVYSHPTWSQAQSVHSLYLPYLLLHPHFTTILGLTRSSGADYTGCCEIFMSHGAGGGWLYVSTVRTGDLSSTLAPGKRGFLKQAELPRFGDGDLCCLDSCLISFIPTANLPCISILACICFLLATCSPCSRSTCQLQTGTCQEHLPATEQQQGHLPSASEETKPWAAAAADLQLPLRGIQGREWGTLLQETGGADIFPGTGFIIPILASLHN